MASRYKTLAMDSISKNSREGDEVLKRGNEIKREADDTKNILEGEIEIVDEDTQEAVDKGIQQSADITERLANIEVYTPSKEISDSLREVGEQMGEDANTEMNNAKMAEKINGDYGDVGASVETDSEKNSQEFQEISDDGFENADNLEEASDSIIEDLMEIF